MRLPRPAFVVCVVLAALFSTASPSAAQVDLCSWKSVGNPPIQTSKNYAVEWGSTADPAGGKDVWNIATFVGNIQNSVHPDVNWIAAGMHVENLKPQEFAIACHEQQRDQRSAGRQATNGPLADGPLVFAKNVPPINTPLYWVGAPPVTAQTYDGKPLDLKSTVFVIARDTKNREVELRVTTRLEKTAGGYHITYTIQNLSGRDAVVEFPVDPELSKQSDGGKLFVKGKDSKSASVDTKTFPQITRYPLTVSESAKDAARVTVRVLTARALPRNQ